MTAQAKNRLLAYIVLAMLFAVVYFGNRHEPVPFQTKPVTILLPKAKPVLVAIEPKLDQAEFECLRTNLYHEAGNQSRHGMEAVALVALRRTRTKHYPSTLCGVVKAWAYNDRGRKVCQFSWYCDGKPDEPKLTLTAKVHGKRKVVPNLAEQKAWELATEVATAAMEGKIKDFLGGATNYHADYVNPAFANAPKRYKFIAKIGSHLFYRDIALKLKA